MTTATQPSPAHVAGAQTPQVILNAVDAYRLLGDVLDRSQPLTIIDGGANIGAASADMLESLAPCNVHAFEPTSGPFASLERLASASRGRVMAHHLALGDHDETRQINVNANGWTSSFLPASERGRCYHGQWMNTLSTEQVRVVTLDRWAHEHGVSEIDLLKLDLQGYELPALRGALRLLAAGRIAAVYAEAQFIPEYDGATTFSDIDTLLTANGFGLYQVIDLCLKGRHYELSCCDALWLRKDVLAKARASSPSVALLAGGDRRAAALGSALAGCSAQGLGRVAIYGAGQHTRACGAALLQPPVDVVAIIDDNAATHGTRLWGYPIISRDRALTLGLDAVVLSSDAAEDHLARSAQPLADAGVRVVRLYGRSTREEPSCADA